MERFVKISGIAAPLLRINVDTDQIIPGTEIIRSTDESHTRWGCGLFAHWRYLDNGMPNPEFILNREPWTHAVILLAGRNFGCGSSREPAAKALRGFGLRAVIAPSFGGIFFNNCFRHGLLPVELPVEQIYALAEQVEATKGRGHVTVNLEAQAVTTPDGSEFSFHTPQPLRRMLLDGTDEIEETLRNIREIEVFRASDRARRPWAYRLP